ncbi:MAG: anti-sigma factor [Phaeodactylibacter sp.]|nr:anti-sigma factor [Phaeodactylibacter sp.]MCB9299290.1 anti-sigma factor [Lewinellaceae bacterium]HQU60061.1 anti-sigma factor [Saprospiraceae bacterium]
MMDKERFLKKGLLEQYVLGLADEEEALEVERYARAYPEIQKEIDSLRVAMDEYAGQYIQLPPEELKARAAQSSPSLSLLPRWTAVAGIALLIFLSYLALSLYNGKVVADQHYQMLSLEFEALKEDCARREAVQQIYAFMADAGTQPVILNGSGPAPEAFAIVFWNKKQQLAYLNPAGLPAPPPGKTYQIWADVEGKMINMGLIDRRRSEFQSVRFIEGAESINITLEPEGGSKEPTVSLLCANGNV